MFNTHLSSHTHLFPIVKDMFSNFVCLSKSAFNLLIINYVVLVLDIRGLQFFTWCSCFTNCQSWSFTNHLYSVISRTPLFSLFSYFINKKNQRKGNNTFIDTFLFLALSVYKKRIVLGRRVHISDLHVCVCLY